MDREESRNEDSSSDSISDYRRWTEIKMCLELFALFFFFPSLGRSLTLS